ncbi:hypothetical protein BRC93_01560 [Halobacteriales archaeon QS_5_70_15]|nr:MAG: hypothetical protein BRC93_01560 [Halobacteriales archaeon QS_5_70_15]
MRGVTLAVCPSVLFAGCAFGGPGSAPTSTPTPTPGSSEEWTVRYNLTNAEPTPDAVTVGAVDGPVDSFELRLDGGGARTITPEFPAVLRRATDGRLRVRGRLRTDCGGAGESGVRAAGLARCGSEDRMYSVDVLVGSCTVGQNGR